MIPSTDGRLKSWDGECLGICGGRGGGGSTGNLNAVTDAATVLYLCSETDVRHTFRYFYVYLGGLHSGRLWNSVKSCQVWLRKKHQLESMAPLGSLYPYSQGDICILTSRIPRQASFRSAFVKRVSFRSTGM